MGTLSAGADAIIIGGGPAGSAAATGLARAGAAVKLLERERTCSAKVCGEFLSIEACEEARSLGVDPLELGAAPIDRVRVSWRGTTVESSLPFRAASLSRAAFDAALLAAAARSGAQILRNTRALSLEPTHLTARADSETTRLETRAFILATGKSELPGQRRSGGHFPDALGFKMHLRLAPRDHAGLGSAVELALFPGGYCGMQRLENPLTAFALVIRRDTYARLGSWRALLRHIAAAHKPIAAILENATELWPRPLAVSGVPYGFTYHDPPPTKGDPTTPNLYRIGDQLAVIPSFTGDGIAIALVTGTHAAKAIAQNQSPSTFHAAMRKRLATPMLVAGVLSRAITTPMGRAAVVWPASIAPQIFTAVASLTRINRT
jgi:flavin-dependent dehydrogenase